MRRSLVILTLLSGCRREPSSDAAMPSPSATSSTSSSSAASPRAPAGSVAAPAASDAPAQGPRVRLVARKPTPTGRAQAAVTAPELGLDEIVGELVEPHTCLATRRGRSLGVSCTPGYRADRLVITEDAGGLVVERPGGKRSVVTIAAGTTVTLQEGEVSARDVTPCAPGGPPRTIDVSVQSHWDMDEGNFLRVVLGAAGPTVVELFRDRHRGQLRCSVAEAAERRTLTCDGRPSRCELWLADGKVRFRCDAPEPHDGGLRPPNPPGDSASSAPLREPHDGGLRPPNPPGDSASSAPLREPHDGGLRPPNPPGDSASSAPLREPREGSLLLPCGGVGRFAKQGVLSQTVHYY